MNSCNQCKKEMEGVLEFNISYRSIGIPICTNPECPNFGLLQVGSERIKEVEQDKKHRDRINLKNNYNSLIINV